MQKASFLKQSAIVAVAGIIASLFLTALVAEPTVSLVSGDAPDYISMAHTIRHQGLLSVIERNNQGRPLIGSSREPGYGFVLGLIMALDPASGSFDPACIGKDEPQSCNERALLTPLWVNRGFVALSGLLLFLAAQRLTGGLLAPALAGSHIWLNVSVHKNTVGIISDSLALLLVAALSLAIIWAGRSIYRWWLPGLILAALALTKAVFHVFALSLALTVLIYALFSRNRRILAALALAALAYIPPTFGWMTRNAALGADFSITSNDIRPGIMLLYRNLLNQLTFQQYLCAFVYWTPGIGDDLARAWFDQEIWKSFPMDSPSGFYQRSHRGYKHIVAAGKEKANLDTIVAHRQYQKEYNQHLAAQILLTQPFKHIATTLPLFYRGMWGDLFAPVSIPCLIIITFVALRQKRWSTLLPLIPGWWSLIFYALVSLNIKRYQMTAIPALSLATASLLAPGITYLYTYLKLKLHQSR